MALRLPPLVRRALFLLAAFWLVSLLPAGAVPEAPPPDPDFAAYLAAHEDTLAPFLASHSESINRQVAAAVLDLFGQFVVVTLLVGFVLDFGLGRGFAQWFAPAYKQITRAIVHAGVRLLCTGVSIGLFAGALVGLSDTVSPVVIVLGLGGLLLLLNLVAQVVEAGIAYRAGPGPTFGYAAISLMLWLGVAALVAGPTVRSRGPLLLTRLEDTGLTPLLQAEIEKQNQALAQAQAQRDRLQRQRDAAQAQLDSAVENEKRLQKRLADWKQSEAYILGTIADVRARGDLGLARQQYLAFLDRFPQGTLAAEARAQVSEIEAELARNLAAKQLAVATAKKQADATEAGLVARLKAGKASLSEARELLLGKGRAEVARLLGPPSETASDRWGYNGPMIFNSLTNLTTGLAIRFESGNVQGVDLYFGQ